MITVYEAIVIKAPCCQPPYRIINAEPFIVHQSLCWCCYLAPSSSFVLLLSSSATWLPYYCSHLPTSTTTSSSDPLSRHCCCCHCHHHKSHWRHFMLAIIQICLQIVHYRRNLLATIIHFHLLVVCNLCSLNFEVRKHLCHRGVKLNRNSGSVWDLLTYSIISAELNLNFIQPHRTDWAQRRVNWARPETKRILGNLHAIFRWYSSLKH